eukprot:TRINITY_DN12311_c0_g1_i5.p1 TRINITY_DN12311_c0_g1~~TRINITY_DN12311_c0_g1_i5.p1  ORF type:complete len:275 (+),score=77.95 TRINITY_DN12311_c0_g1_i5:93-917(+)
MVDSTVVLHVEKEEGENLHETEISEKSEGGGKEGERVRERDADEWVDHPSTTTGDSTTPTDTTTTAAGTGTSNTSSMDETNINLLRREKERDREGDEKERDRDGEREKERGGSRGGGLGTTDGARRDREKSRERRDRRELEILPRPPRSYYDPYRWLDDFLPYWVTTGNVPRDPIGRMKRNVHNLSKSCSTLFVRNLPDDVTKRELSSLFCFLPNFKDVRLVVKTDKNGMKAPLAFIDFVDDASAYVAMCCMQSFYYSDRSIYIEYDKYNKNSY